MTEIERLRSIVKTLGDTCVMTMHPGTHKMLVQSVEALKERIADLEAKQSLYDRWSSEKEAVSAWENCKQFDDTVNRDVAFYVRWLESKIREFEGQTNDRA